MRRLLLGLALLVGAAPSVFAQSIVQSSTITGPITTSTGTATLGAGCTSGNTLVALLTARLASHTVSGVDGGGGTHPFTQVPSARGTDSTVDAFTDIWYLPNCAGSLTTGTVTFDSAVTDGYFQLVEITAISSPSNGGANSTNPAMTTDPPAGTITTTTASDILVGLAVIANNWPPTAWGGGFTALDHNNSGAVTAVATGYDIVSTTGTYTGTAPTVANQHSVGSVAAFKQTGGGATGCVGQMLGVWKCQ